MTNTEALEKAATDLTGAIRRAKDRQRTLDEFNTAIDLKVVWEVPDSKEDSVHQDWIESHPVLEHVRSLIRDMLQFEVDKANAEAASARTALAEIARAL